MSVTSVDNQDLQTYLDSFNKEIEETDTSFVTLPADSANPDPMNGDDLAQRIVRDFNDGLEEDEEEDGTYFVDQDGNYYFQSSKEEEAPVPIKLNKSTKQKSPATITTRRSTSKKAVQLTANITKAKEDNSTMNYVLMADDLESIAEDDNDDPDDPDYTGKAIFDFNETAEGSNEDGAEESLLRPTANHIRVKSNAKNQDPKADIISCQHCKYTTKKKFLLARHMRTHSDERPFKCAVCERGFKTQSSLLNHVNMHLGNKPHACKSCSMSFTTSGEMVRHTRYKHTGEKPHKCTECDYSSVELSKLRRHIRCHTGERPYQCPHCTYASPDTFKLKRHLRTHTGEKPYECDICQARFTQSNSLKAHRLIHSVTDKPIFQCELCPTTCGRKTDLRMHIQKIHHSEHPINCKRCGKDLPDRYSYKMHMKTHEGEKCYRCELCAYASISVRHLESHMLIHTDEKPFVCEFCNLSFRQRQLLQRHLNLYHNDNYKAPSPREKAHACPHCKRAFTHKGNLMRHMEMHDPDSRTQREKLKLKIGRMTRVQADGSVSSVGTGKLYSNEEEIAGNEDDENLEQPSTEEDYEIIETIDVADEVTDQKPIISEAVAESIDLLPQNVFVKNEALLAVEGDDGEEQYMVLEVIQTDDEEGEDDENSESVLPHLGMLTSTNASKVSDVENCFGFEEEEEEEEEFDDKETIHLLDIDEED